MVKKILLLIMLLSAVMIQPIKLYMAMLQKLVFPSVLTEYALLAFIILSYSALLYGALRCIQSIKHGDLTDEEAAVSEHNKTSHISLIITSLLFGLGITLYNAYSNKYKLLHVAAEHGCEASFNLACSMGANELSPDALAPLIAISGDKVSEEKHCVFFSKSLALINTQSHQHLLKRYHVLCRTSPGKVHLARCFEEIGFKPIHPHAIKPKKRPRKALNTTKWRVPDAEFPILQVEP